MSARRVSKSWIAWSMLQAWPAAAEPQPPSSAQATPPAMLSLEPCAGSGAVALRLSSDFADGFSRAFASELSSELLLRGRRLCHEPAAGAAAVLEVRRRGAYSVSLTASTAFHTNARTVDLGALPEDGRALAAALAADELVSALLLVPPPAAPAYAAEPIDTAAREAPPKAVPQRDVDGPRLGLLTEGRLYKTGTGLFGAGVFLNQAIAHGWGLGATLSGLVGVPIQRDNGTIHSAAGEARLGVYHRTVWETGVAFEPQLGLALGWFRFKGAPDAGVDGAVFAGSVVSGQAQLVLSFPLHKSMHLRFGGGLLVPFGELLVEDSGVRVGGLSTVGGLFTAGLGVTL